MRGGRTTATAPVTTCRSAGLKASDIPRSSFNIRACASTRSWASRDSTTTPRPKSPDSTCGSASQTS